MEDEPGEGESVIVVTVARRGLGRCEGVVVESKHRSSHAIGHEDDRKYERGRQLTHTQEDGVLPACTPREGRYYTNKVVKVLIVPSPYGSDFAGKPFMHVLRIYTHLTLVPCFKCLFKCLQVSSRCLLSVLLCVFLYGLLYVISKVRFSIVGCLKLDT